MNLRQRAELNEMMIRLADGDRSVFDSVYTLLFPVVQSFAMKYFGNFADADDIAQQTLVKIFGQAQNYDRSSDVLAWVLTIASFECRTLRQKYRRKRESYFSAETLDQVSSESLDPEGSALNQALKENLLKVFNEMRVEDQETILVSITDRQRPEVPAATFRKRLQRALATLKSAWRAEYGID